MSLCITGENVCCEIWVLVLIVCSAMGEVLTGIRVRAEGIGITSKTTTTCLILWYDSRIGPRSGEFALLAFAAGQLAYGVFVFAVYLSHFRELSWWRAHIAPTYVNVSFPSSLCIAHVMSSDHS